MKYILCLLFIIFITIVTLITLKIKKTVITLLLIFIIGTTCLYIFNISFRDNINMNLSISTNHRYSDYNSSYHLPLPSKSSLKYRTSDNSAVYITKSDINSIAELYKKEADNDTFSENKIGSNLIMMFKYNGTDIHVSVEPLGNANKLTVDIPWLAL